MKFRFTKKTGLLGTAIGSSGSMAMPTAGLAQNLKGGTLHIALLNDVNNFDPQSFLAVNFPLIKNFYDSLIEYDEKGNAIPSLATAWKLRPTASR